MCPKQGMEPCQKHMQAQRERQNYFLLFHKEEWVLPAASTKEPQERKFVVDSVASMHVVSKRDPNSAELETMRTSRSPTTVMTANGEVQTREEATVLVKQMDLFVTVILLGKLPQFSFLGSSARIMGFHTTGPAVKKHISPSRARELIAICHLCTIRSPGSSTSSSVTPTSTSSSSS